MSQSCKVQMQSRQRAMAQWRACALHAHACMHAHNIPRVPWRKLSGNNNGIKSGSFRHFVAFGLSFRHACLCDGAPILSAMTTPTKMRNVSIYRLSRMWDGYGALRREAESRPWYVDRGRQGRENYLGLRGRWVLPGASECGRWRSQRRRDHDVRRRR